MFQREQALLEQRNRIKQASTIMYGVTVSHEHVDFTVSASQRVGQQPVLDLAIVKQLISNYLSAGIPAGKDFEQIIDEIYDTVSIVYPERDIEVNVYDNNGHYTVTKKFNFINHAI